MTRIILFLLKCVVGLFATVGFLLIAAVVAGVLLLPRFEPLQPRVAEVPGDTVLVLDLSQGLVERRPDNPLARASLGRTLVLRDAVTALEAAGRDARVKGLVIRAGWGTPGLAQMQELRDAVAGFRAQGKPVTAFAETFGEAGNGTLHYFLASAAGEIWMQPSGDLGITGFALEQPFLKPLLDDLGVRAQVAQREEYKGAMSFLTDEAMPPPIRENLQRYLDSALLQIATSIAEARNLEAAAVRRMVDRAPYRGQKAVELGLIDRLGYWDEVEDVVDAAAGDDAAWLPLGDYARAAAPESDENAPVIALVHGEGPILLAESENDPVFGRVALGAVDVAQALAAAIDDPEVAAIVFRVDSPGGSYVGSDTIWREVQRARDLGKPLVVSMGNVAASGGYFVSAPAEAIVAQPGTLTGSIGVVAGKVSLRELWADVGVNWDGVQAGQRAAIWSPSAPFSRDEWDWLQQTLDATYADFTGKVAAGRGLTRDEVLAVAKGQVWSGADAKAAGLVDELGGYQKALALAKGAAGIAEDAAVAVRAFPEERDPFAAFLEDTLGGNLGGGEIDSPGLRALLRGLARVAQALAPLVQAVESLTADPRSQTLQSPGAFPVR
ncbi:MAG: S49 family peptidase [Kiloniellaceae bacterium]